MTSAELDHYIYTLEHSTPDELQKLYQTHCVQTTRTFPDVISFRDWTLLELYFTRDWYQGQSPKE